MGSIRKGIVLSGSMALGLALACGRRPASSALKRFQLISIDVHPLPFAWHETPNGCLGRISGGWFEIGNDEWSMADSVVWQCGSWNMLVVANPLATGPSVLRHSGDTLDFAIADGLFDPGFLVEWRGTMRRDSLYVVDSFSSDSLRTYATLGSPGRLSDTEELLSLMRWHVDSATAIRIADSVFRAPMDQSTSIVTSFERHSFGYVIELIPRTPANPHEGSRRGGGVVAVGRNGGVKVLRRYE